MTRVDQFESVFRAADKERFSYRRIEIQKILVVTDLDASEAAPFLERVRGYLAVLGDDALWKPAFREAFQTVGDLLDLVEKEAPDLICTYRNLRSHAWKWPYSLGVHLDVLTQETRVPIMVFPHPGLESASGRTPEDTRTVMGLTDHLAGDDRLVNHAARFTRKDGTLILAHVEDQAVFDRTMDTISKVPSIDTDTAREDILRQLLKEPEDYIESCRHTLKEQNLQLTTRAVVTVGHHIREYKRLVEDHDVDLLVMNTKDKDQMAMHGLAYPLAVEIRSIPLYLL